MLVHTYSQKYFTANSPTILLLKIFGTFSILTNISGKLQKRASHLSFNALLATLWQKTDQRDPFASGLSTLNTSCSCYQGVLDTLWKYLEENFLPNVLLSSQ